MKGLKEFLLLLKEDKKLFSEVEKVQEDTAKVVEIAKSHGYTFTEDEYNDLKMEAVSGGRTTGGFNLDGLKDVSLGNLLNYGINLYNKNKGFVDKVIGDIKRS